MSTSADCGDRMCCGICDHKVFWWVGCIRGNVHGGILQSIRDGVCVCVGLIGSRCFERGVTGGASEEQSEGGQCLWERKSVICRLCIISCK